MGREAQRLGAVDVIGPPSLRRRTARFVGEIERAVEREFPAPAERAALGGRACWR
jgi:hypothetical protein